MRNNPKPGEVWMYCKGTNYTIIANAKLVCKHNKAEYVVYSKCPLNLLLRFALDNNNFFEVFDTESNRIFWINRTDDNEFLLTQIDKTWEEKDKNDETLWGRPLNNFMEVLGNGTTHFYRFSMV